MFPSDYQISNLADNQLRIAAPGQILFAALLIAVGLVPTGFFLYRIVKSSSLYPALGILLFGLPVIFCGLIVSRGGSLTLDKSSDTALFRMPKLLWHTDTVVPLHTVQYATIRTMRGSSYIAVVLTNGDALTFADSTQQGGKGRAVEAINRFLGVEAH